MRTIDKSQLLSLIAAGSIFASGVFAYFTCHTPNSDVSNPSSEFSSINKSDILMQAINKSDEYLSNNHDIITHPYDFNGTQKEVTVNPDPSNQTLRPNAELRVKINSSEIISITSPSPAYHYCSQTMSEIETFYENIKNATVEWNKSISENKRNDEDSATSKLNATDEHSNGVSKDIFKDEILVNLELNATSYEGLRDIYNKTEETCKKDGIYNSEVCPTIGKFSFVNQEVRDILWIINNYKPLEEETRKNLFNILFNLDKMNNELCTTLTLRIFFRPSSTGTKNSNTIKTSIKYTCNGGNSMSRSVFDKKLNILGAEKMLFIIFILKLHL